MMSPENHHMDHVKKGDSLMGPKQRGPRRHLRRAVATGVPLLMIFLLALPAKAQDSTSAIPDPDITQAIETEYWADELINANAIDIATEDGIVTLTGTVHNILSKERAVRIAEAIRGVRGVVNRLEVVPVRAMSDTDLQVAVGEALLLDPATGSYQVGVSTLEGIVTLTGTVNSYQEKDLCETVVKGVSGVRGVIDKLDVRFLENRDDSELEHEVVERLRNDVHVDDKLISVAVDRGIVSLYGSVGSLAEKNRAVWDAWVGGVHGVQSDDLEVTWSGSDMIRESAQEEPPGDEALQRAVEDAFLYDPRVVPFNPVVTVSDGIVTLNGVVDNLEARYAAESDAKNVTGVWRVKNFVKVRPSPFVADQELEARVEAALDRDPILQADEITVNALAGDIRLTGRVGSRLERERADHVAARVGGVVSVSNMLTYPSTWVWKPDWEIRRDLNVALARSLLGETRNILITVDHGVVSLAGTVATWSERSMIERSAYAAGAKEVHNDLTAKDAAYDQTERPFFAPLGEGY